MTEQWYKAYLAARKAEGLSAVDSPYLRRVANQYFNDPDMPTPEYCARGDYLRFSIPLSEPL